MGHALEATEAIKDHDRYVDAANHTRANGQPVIAMGSAARAWTPPPPRPDPDARRSRRGRFLNIFTSQVRTTIRYSRSHRPETSDGFRKGRRATTEAWTRSSITRSPRNN